MKVLPPRRSGSCAPACVPSPHCVPGLYGQPAPLWPWIVRPDYIPSPLRGFVWLGDCCAGVAPCRAPPPACGLPPHCVPGLYGQPAPLRPWVVRSDYIPSPLRGFVWLGDCCTGVPPCQAPPPACGLSPFQGLLGAGICRGFVWLGDCCTGVPPCQAPPPVCGLSPRRGSWGLTVILR